MKRNDFLPPIKTPCNQCPYHLGLVRTFTNPCPQCKANGYQAFKRFQRGLPVDGQEKPSLETAISPRRFT